MPHLDRSQLKWIADGTLKVLRAETIQHPATGQLFDLGPWIRAMMKDTRLYRPSSTSLTPWRSIRPPALQDSPVVIEFHDMTTLQGARYIVEEWNRVSSKQKQVEPPCIGVLNFASATLPGGGWRTGALAQEESLARASTLPVALERNSHAKEFYSIHKQRGGSNGGYYTHAMIWSPNVVIFRDDIGQWLDPMDAAVVTCAAVNAKEARVRSNGWNPSLESMIEDQMRERMGRLLALFEQRCRKDLVLGAFGAGVFQNDVVMVGKIWGELLDAPNARFKRSFRSVVFAVPNTKTLAAFRNGFEFGASQGQRGLARRRDP